MKIKKLNIMVEVAENDDQGNKSGYVSMFRFGDLLTLESICLGKEKFSHMRFKRSGNTGFRVHRKSFQYYTEHAWLGNMVWNGYKVHWWTVCELINHLWKSDKWSIHCGDSILVEHLENYDFIMQGDFWEACERYYKSEAVEVSQN